MAVGAEASTAAGEASEEAGTAAGGEGPSAGSDLVLKVLGAVGTGIGILGFVTFFGGAILWVRANEMGLPPSEAVAVIPRSVLVTTGASFLVPAVLLALLAVLLIATVHLTFAVPARLSTRKRSRDARERRNAADAALRSADPQEQIAAAKRADAQRIAEIVDTMSQRSAAEDDAPSARRLARPAATEETTASMQRLAQEVHTQALHLEISARGARAHAEELESEAKQAEASLQSARTSSAVAEDARLVVECVGAFVILAVLPLLIYGNLFDVGLVRALILVGVAVAAAIVSLAVYLTTERFVWLGVVAFVSVGVYTGCATYFRTLSNPKVEPAAVLRGERPPLAGMFVAATSEEVYLGAFARGDEHARLLIVPRAQVTDLAVGPLLAPSVARRRAIELTERECRQQIEQGDADGVKAKAAAPACTKRQQTALLRQS